MDQSELSKIYTFALSLARDAGRILVQGVDARCQQTPTQENVQEKLNSVDIVTQTDLDVEAFVKTAIAKQYPTHKFIGEETYSSSAHKDYLIGNEPTWCVDPLDGTVNYTHLFPLFCISIAFFINGNPVIGVIHAPNIDATYSACSGQGAWLDDGHDSKQRRRLPLMNNPVPPLPPNAPKGCVFSCEWGKDRRDIENGNLTKKVNSFWNMAAEVGGRNGKGGMVHGVRSLGSAALDLAYVATGAFDIWWEAGCWEWDVAAGVCILKEAGGLITTANPPADLDAPIPDAKIGSRLYLAIRAAGQSELETGKQQQEKLVREVWKRVATLDYSRPGA